MASPSFLTARAPYFWELPYFFTTFWIRSNTFLSTLIVPVFMGNVFPALVVLKRLNPLFSMRDSWF